MNKKAIEQWKTCRRGFLPGSQGSCLEDPIDHKLQAAAWRVMCGHGSPRQQQKQPGDEGHGS
ncbi:hypothetical protein [Candidatus Amarobacter glycogenicus]|uniref:hypothetical protein n=1 Tax=Candidatus Amarobacter glycogenicus TaxID=3140699 RepID=UPI003135ECF5|nr:hypothetical protein [Dehalococcoidia bacterium]